MGRVRSPSPRRDRERRRSRSRDRDRRVRHRRSHSRSPHRRRSRSKSPHRRRSRSKSPHRRRSRSPVARRKSSSPSSDRDGILGSKKSGKSLDSTPEINEEELAGLDPDEAEMMKMMGFAGFSSTKGKKVEGNDIFAANIITKRKFRQYMNRRGGFNRPLDFIA